jgi:WD40 repeat protein
VCPGPVTALSVRSPRWIGYACDDRTGGAVDTRGQGDVELVLDAPGRTVEIDEAGQWLLVGTHHGAIHVHDLVSGFEQVLRGHRAGVVALAAPTAVWAQIATADDKGEMRLWPLPRWPARVVAGPGAQGFTALISNDSRRLIASSAAGSVRLWRLPEGRCQALVGHSNLVHRMRLSRDGGRAVTAGYDGSARLWDLDSGQLIEALDAHGAGVADIEFLDDEIVVAGQDGHIEWWSPDQHRHRTLYDAGLPLLAIEPMAASHAVAVDLAGGHLGIVDRTGTWREITAAAGLASTALRASPDGTQLALGDDLGNVTLYEPQRDRLRNVARLAHAIRHTTFDDSGTRLAVAGEDGTLALIALGPRPHTIWSLQAQIRFVAFSHSGLLAAAGRDGAVRLYVPGDDRWRVLRLGSAELISLHFSSDDRQLVAMSGDGRIALIDVAAALATSDRPAVSQPPFPRCPDAENSNRKNSP